MKKNILVVLGHPSSKSFCAALADAYIEGAADSGAEVKALKLGEIKFDPILWNGYSEIQELEPDLIEAQELIKWANHIVFVYPNWWGTIPALLKGFFDRVFLPGFAFKFGKSPANWDKLLKGRTAELIVTMDTPVWFYRWIYKKPGHNEMKKSILGFCGIKVHKITEFSPITQASAEQRNKWLAKVRKNASLV